MEKIDNPGIVRLNDVIKTYFTGAGEVTVLKNINMEIKQGEFVSVVGPSGSGKTTLLNMITGIDRPTSGKVVVAGQTINTMGEDVLASWRGRNIGVIFQFFQLLPALTVLENVILPMDFCQYRLKSDRRACALELLEMVGIEKHADKLPSALSGGEQQRAAIARSLATEPLLIVADEPTGNLDTKTAHEIIVIFEKLVAMGRTVMIVTHDVGISQRTQRIVRLLDGEIYQDVLVNQDKQSAKERRHRTRKGPVL